MVPGSPAAVGGRYLVIGPVIDSVPEYGLMIVELWLSLLGGIVISGEFDTGLSVVGSVVGVSIPTVPVPDIGAMVVVVGSVICSVPVYGLWMVT
jgi:hypothetical protein